MVNNNDKNSERNVEDLIEMLKQSGNNDDRNNKENKLYPVVICIVSWILFFYIIDFGIIFLSSLGLSNENVAGIIGGGVICIICICIYIFEIKGK